jgi:hypothetical protein
MARSSSSKTKPPNRWDRDHGPPAAPLTGSQSTRDSCTGIAMKWNQLNRFRSTTSYHAHHGMGLQRVPPSFLFNRARGPILPHSTIGRGLLVVENCGLGWRVGARSKRTLFRLRDASHSSSFWRECEHVRLDRGSMVSADLRKRRISIRPRTMNLRRLLQHKSKLNPRRSGLVRH